MKSNTWTIIKKEFARFFGDRTLLFTAVIMPGLLIYFVYSLMGNGINKMITDGIDDIVTLRVENMPEFLAADIAADSHLVVVDQPFGQEDIDLLDDDDLNVVLVRFPEGFDSLVAAYDPQCGLPAPNVEIYYNSNNNASKLTKETLTALLEGYEYTLSNRFDINRADNDEVCFDAATSESIGEMVWSKLLPMLIVMMLFSGTMAIAPSAIAGEKERGTIATLLVTPMRRNELAFGKIVSLSGMALLSGISSFLGIAFSLPRMISAGDDVDLGFSYTFPDYAAMLLAILSTVLIMASAVSLLSALAKDVKSAGTMITPLMIVVMIAGLLPMLQNGTATNIAVYAIPFYNSIETMAEVFAHDMQWAHLLTTVVSNTVYTGLAVWGLAKMFNSEKIMFSR